MCFQSRKAAKKRYGIVLVSILVLAMAFSETACAGIIRTTISSQCTITASGDLELRFEIQNEGNVTAHKMAATLNLADVIRRFPDLGENLPGDKMTLKDRIDCSGWSPGVYVCSITVSFEEQNGKPHLVDHFFTVPSGIKAAEAERAPLKMLAGSLVFNPKAFWNKEKPLQVTLKNTGDTAITPELSLYLPEGYASPEAAKNDPLSPGSESVVALPVIRNSNAKPGKVLHLIATYNFRGLHYEALLREVIHMERKPVLFRVYLVVSGVVILVVGGVVIVRRRVKSDE